MRLRLALGALALACATPSLCWAQALFIHDVTVVSPERRAPLTHADVLILGDRIAKVGRGLRPPAGARALDGRRRFLVPGLIDSHVHVDHQGPLDEDALEHHPQLLADYRDQLPRSYLAFGFTTLVDFDLRPGSLDWYGKALVRPSLYNCGRAVRVVGGYTAQRPPKSAAAAAEMNLVYEPDRAASWPKGIDPAPFTPPEAVRRDKAMGARCVKVFYEPGFGGAADWPVPLPQTMSALREASRAEGLPLAVHANSVEAWRAALDAGADIIAHGLWHWKGSWTQTAPPPEARQVIARAARAGVRVQPTIQSVAGDVSIFDDALLRDTRLREALPGSIVAYLKGPEGQAARRATQDEYRSAIKELHGDKAAADPGAAMSVGPARAIATLRLMSRRGVALIFGSDTPANEGLGNPPGLNGRLEMADWVAAGVRPAAVLRAATLENARALGLEKELGSVTPGKRADLLLLAADPLKSVSAYDRIVEVVFGGRPIPRADLLPTR